MSRRNQRDRRRARRTSKLSIPEQIPGLQAWFDSRTDAYFTFSTGSQISAWASRAGSMGAIAATQATSSFQPTRTTGLSQFNGKQGVLFDGTNDLLQANNAASAWNAHHDGTGGTHIIIRQIDSTGGGSQYVLDTAITTSEIGTYLLYHSTSSGQVVISNGSGVAGVNGNAYSYQGIRDAAGWNSVSYETNSRIARGSGEVSTQADTVGQSVNTGNASRAMRIGGAGGFKGVICQYLAYKGVLTAAQIQTIVDYFARDYSWAVLDGATSFSGSNYLATSGLAVPGSASGFWVAGLFTIDSQSVASSNRYILRSTCASRLT